MTLRIGSRGDDVRALQAALRSLRFYAPPSVIDGDFGPKTEAAVRAFQRDRGLVVDGIVGPKTWTAVLHPAGPAQQRPPFPMPRAWPLRCLRDGRVPVITSGHSVHNPSRPKHYGVDLLYRYREGVDPPTPIGDSGRTKGYWIPAGTIACAAFDGRIVIAGNSSTGMRAWLQHDSGWAAGYFHMDLIRVHVGQVVTVGDPIGRVNDNPRDTDPDHLHWEMYFGDIADDVPHGRYPRGTVDAELMLQTTPYLPA